MWNKKLPFLLPQDDHKVLTVGDVDFNSLTDDHFFNSSQSLSRVTTFGKLLPAGRYGENQPKSDTIEFLGLLAKVEEKDNLVVWHIEDIDTIGETDQTKKRLLKVEILPTTNITFDTENIWFGFLPVADRETVKLGDKIRVFGVLEEDNQQIKAELIVLEKS